jgi:hypothetical protein
MAFFAWVNRHLCKHANQLRRSGNGRMWLECADCGRETGGIPVTGTAITQATRKRSAGGRARDSVNANA